MFSLLNKSLRVRFLGPSAQKGTNVRRLHRSGLVWMLAAVTLLAFGAVGVHGAQAATSGGYWLVGSDGTVYEFAGAPLLAPVARSSTAPPIVGMAATPDGRGYWLADAD